MWGRRTGVPEHFATSPMGFDSPRLHTSFRRIRKGGNPTRSNLQPLTPPREIGGAAMTALLRP